MSQENTRREVSRPFTLNGENLRIQLDRYPQVPGYDGLLTRVTLIDDNTGLPIYKVNQNGREEVPDGIISDFPRERIGVSNSPMTFYAPTNNIAARYCDALEEAGYIQRMTTTDDYKAYLRVYTFTRSANDLFR